VLIPSIAFVALIEYLGIYVASAIFIFAFMIVIGRERPLKAFGVSVVVPLALFFMFERWFLVPLPKCELKLCNQIEELFTKEASYERLLRQFGIVR